MKKRFLNLFMALALVLCVLPMAANAAGCAHVNGTGTTLQKQVKVEATCAEAGYEEHYVCSNCNKIYVPNYGGYKQVEKPVIPATGKHNYVLDTTVNDGYREGDEATCTETGIFVLKCSTAGCTATTAQLAPVDKDRHTPVKGICSGCGVCVNNHVSNKIVTSAKAPTCTEPGAKKNVHQCKVCGIYFCNGVYKTTEDFPENVIPATNTHDFSVWKANVTPATCTKREVERYQCKTCTATEDREVGNLLSNNGAHTPGKMLRYIARPTCQATGEAEYECTVCDENVIQVVRKLNCNIVDLEAKAPTCILTGLTAGKTCTICDDTTKNQNCAYCASIKVEQEVVDALGHDHVLVKTNKKVTCTKDGEGVYDCTRCGYDGVVKVIPKLNHADVEEILRDATCTRDGWKEVTCSNEGCGKCVTVKIPATGHTEEVIPEEPATCTATGLSEGKKCSVCGEILVAQTVTSMISHEFTVDVDGVDATCTADGYTAHKKCAHCDATQGKEEIDTDGHNFVNYVCTVCGVRDGSCEHEGASITVQDPTCTVDGKESFSCPTCGYSYEEVLEAAGHTEQVHSTAGNCVTQGKTWTVCTVCGQITVPESATGYGGHNYVNNQCTVCGEVNPESICNHTGGRSFQTDAATCTRDGITIETCDDCGNVVDRVTVPAKGHNYVNGICSRCDKKNSNRLTTDFQDVFIVG